MQNSALIIDSRRHQHSKAAFAQGEFDWTITNQFSVELHRHFLFAFNSQMPGLEIFDLRRSNFRAENDILQVFDDLKIPDPLENDDVKQAVIDNGVFEKRKWPAVESAVADQQKRSFVDRSVLRLNRQTRWPADGDLGGGDQVTHRPEVPPKRIAGFLEHLGVKTYAAQLHKKLLIRERQIDETCFVVLNHAPAKIE